MFILELDRDLDQSVPVFSMPVMTLLMNVPAMFIMLVRMTLFIAHKLPQKKIG